MKQRFILDKGEPFATDDEVIWGKWMSETDRRARETRVGKFTITTVFSGIDLREKGEAGEPALWAVMLDEKGKEASTMLARFSDREQALDHHGAMVPRYLLDARKDGSVEPVEVALGTQTTGGKL